METILLSIAVCHTYFLTASSLYFTTPPSTTPGYTKSIFTTEATTETNQELVIPINTTDLAPPVTTTKDSTITTALSYDAQTHPSLSQSVIPTEKTTPVHEFNSNTETQYNTIDASKTTETDKVMFQTNTSLTTSSYARLTPQNENKNETGRQNTSHNNYTIDASKTTESERVMFHTNTSLTTSSFARLTPQKEDRNETGRQNTSYNNDTQFADTWNATTVKQPTSEPFNSVQTVSRKEWTVNDTTQADEEIYKMISTQATFTNSSEDTERTEGTTGSYGLTTEHTVLMHTEEHYTTPNTTSAIIENNWITSRNVDTPMTTTDYTTLDGMNITDAPENQSSTPGIVRKIGRRREDSEVNESTTHNMVTKENRTPSITLDTTNNINSSIEANFITDGNINATSIKPDPKNNVLPECFNTNSKQTPFQQSKLVCFITLWTLAMTASIFLGITIFLWVRLSVLKKSMKIKGGGQVEKGGQKMEKESLWADPKASVQERVEFWYVTGSTLEADRKERGKRREERFKQKKEEQGMSENELWIQPRVTEDDISEFWYANRRMKEERTRIGYF